MQNEILFSFDIGTFSTKVSFRQQGSSSSIITKEFTNIILFGDNKQKYFADEATKKLQENSEIHSSYFVTNFVKLLRLSIQGVLDEDETYHTHCHAKTTPDNKVLLFVKRDGIAVTAEKCMKYFLNFIRIHIIKKFFDNNEKLTVKPIVVVSDKTSILLNYSLNDVFVKAGYIRPDLPPFTFAMSQLYNKLHNFVTNKVLMILDVGYSSIKLSIVKLSSGEIEIMGCEELELGLRNFDMEIYVNILTELKNKYRIDYQKDKFIRYDFFCKMNLIRKTFGLNTGVIMNLQDTFGSRYFDQFFKIDQKRYINLNEENFKKFHTFLDKCFEKFYMEMNLQIDDLQIIGGGSKIQKFAEIIQKRFETKNLTDKFSCTFSPSYGGMLTQDNDLRYKMTLGEELDFRLTEIVDEEVKSEKGIESSFDKQDVNAAENAEPKPIEENASQINSKDSKNKFKKKSQKSEDHGSNSEVNNDKPGVSLKLKDKVISQSDEIIEQSYVDLGVIYSANEAFIYQKNEKIVLLPNANSSKMYKLLIYARKNDQSLKLIMKSPILFSNFKSFIFELDKGLLVKPMLFLPVNKKVEFQLFKAKSLETSKISQYESAGPKKSERMDVVFNLDFHEKSNCTCSHDGESKEEHKEARNSLVNAAFMHVFSDFVQDFIMLLTGILLYYRPSWEIIDPILSLLVCSFIIFIAGQFTYRLYRRLMEMVPIDINYQTVLSQLLQIENVTEIHDLHIWDLGNGKNAATAHIATNENKDKILKDATVVFRKNKIFHSTVQIESVNGKNQEFYVNCKNNIDG